MFISLLTDFGLADNFVGVMKGVIFNINPLAKIIDITHSIHPHDIRQAAFILKYSFKFFPKGTIHVVVVDPTVGSKRKNIIVQTDNYYFIGPDNGVLYLAVRQDNIKKIIRMDNDKYFLSPVSDTFQGRDIFAPAAAHLSKGAPIDSLGTILQQMVSIKLPEAMIKKNCLIGEVIHIDNFGNLITNIEKELFENFVSKQRFAIRINKKTITRISHSYCEAKVGDLLAIFDSFNMLEISVNQNSADTLLHSKLGTRITVEKSDI
jgi:hypothetical protein